MKQLLLDRMLRNDLFNPAKEILEDTSLLSVTIKEIFLGVNVANRGN